MIEKQAKETILSYFEDYSNIQGGFAERVLIPEKTEEVSFILRQANNEKIPVTISGGGTGTVGGRIPFGGVVISTELFKKIEIAGSLDTENGKNNKAGALSGAGVLIKDLKLAAEQKGFFYPYDPTEQTASVGGTIATNASGARSLKYGATRNFVHSIEVVLADGNIIQIVRGQYKAKAFKFELDLNNKKYFIPVPRYSMPKVKKHSAGYFAQKNMDLIDLFIGQEGTLGVITNAGLVLAKKPFDIFSCFAFFNNEVDSWNFVIDASQTNALSIEYLDFNSLNLLRDFYPNIPQKAKSCIIFEQEIEQSDEEKILSFWARLLKKHGVHIDNTWVASTPSERKEFQEKRHKLPEIINDFVRKQKTPKISTDLAVPHKNLLYMMDYYKKRLEETDLPYFIFGHIGDAHLHTNIIPASSSDLIKAKEAAKDLVKKSIELEGTVSAEHGIGKVRNEYLKMLYGEDGINQMLEVKRALDPNLILGRGNIIPEEYLL